MDNTTRFTGIAAQYAKYRPSYGGALIDYLYGEVGFRRESVIADIGAGTGIFSKLLLERGSKVFCVEPNNDMLGAAKEFLSGYPAVQFIHAPAEEIPLPDKSVDFITTAQAFHWFDEERFKKECQRLLKTGGKAALIWNCEVFGWEAVDEGDEINRRYCPDYDRALPRSRRGLYPDHSNFFKNGVVEFKTFPNDYVMDEGNFIGRNLSSSYAPKENDANYAGYVAEFRKLFAKYSKDGVFTMPNEVQSYVGEV